jgi:hypothetical protein
MLMRFRECIPRLPRAANRLASIIDHAFPLPPGGTGLEPHRRSHHVLGPSAWGMWGRVCVCVCVCACGCVCEGGEIVTWGDNSRAAAAGGYSGEVFRV